MYTEKELLPISALQHLIFCERQCALIHVEQLWAENLFTVQGKQLHEKAHSGKSETRGELKITRGLWLKSHRLGLLGQADVVEFHAKGSLVKPVEYKRGKPKKDDSDRVQLCAQAICLEEMLKISIESGALFYGTRQRRTDVLFDSDLRGRTAAKAERLHQMIARRETPTAQRDKKCDKCSLLNLCMPDSMRLVKGSNSWVQRQFAAVLPDGPVSDGFSIYE
ncbi:MAG: CRISPR-associated protein Cas4 [Planctomycetota bacterium]